MTKSNSMIERINILVILISSFFFFFLTEEEKLKEKVICDRNSSLSNSSTTNFIYFLLIFYDQNFAFPLSPYRRHGCSIRIRIPSRGIVPRFFLEHRPVYLRALINVSKPSLIRPRHVEYSLSLGRDRRGRGRGCTSVNNYTRKRPARHIAAFPGFASNLRGLI